MNDADAWFRVRCVLRCAFEQDVAGMRSAGVPLGPQRTTNAARAVVRKIERSDTVLREVSRALLEAIEGLELEVERLRTRLDLAEVGVELEPNLVEIGGDGLHLDKTLPFRSGTRVRAWLELPLSGQERLLCVSALVDNSDEGTSITFVDMPGDLRDRIVAFTFQTQALERRRARNRDR
ncbi:MAG: hypothetical protein AB8H79_16475 [Myxococcota bacterium]